MNQQISFAMNNNFQKRIYIILLMMVFTFSVALSATEKTTYTVSLQRTVKKEHNQELDREGTRMPSRPIICTINEQGVQTEISSEDIISYELWDIYGSCLISTVDDKEFVIFLFSSIQAEYQIRIITDRYCFIGYISNL